MANSSFPRQPQGMRPLENPVPTIMGAINVSPSMGIMQQGIMPSSLHAISPGSWGPQPQTMGGFVAANVMSTGAMAPTGTTLTSASSSVAAHKDRNYLQQQQKLRAMASSSKRPGPLSADSLIEDLLQQKETFSKYIPHFQAVTSAPIQANLGTLCGSVGVNPAMPGATAVPTGGPAPSTLPLWLSPEAYDLLPAIYRKVWELTKVPAADGRELVDTSRIFSILLTSGLPRDALGYIWNLANSGIPGVLSRPELNVTLALVALAQSGWRNFSSTAVLNMTQQPPVPILQLEIGLQAPSPSPVAVSPVTSASVPQIPLIAATIPNNFIASPSISTSLQDSTSAFPLLTTQTLNPNQGQQTILNSVQGTSSVEQKQEKGTNILDDNDDFSDFQSAPLSQVTQPEVSKASFFSPRDSPLGFNSFESPPVSPAVMKPKRGSREVGSRLANYSFGAPSSNSSQTSKHSSESGDDGVAASTNDALFPKCAIKPPPHDSYQSSTPTLMFTKDSVTGTGKDIDDLKQTCASKSTNEDKYSALRDLAFEGLTTPEVENSKPIALGQPSVPVVLTSAASILDDFGDFLSAGPSTEDDSFVEISKRVKSIQAPSVIPTVEISNVVPQEWNANFDNFTSSNSQWQEQCIPTLHPMESTSCEVEDDEDFGEFVGPSTLSSLPQLNRLKEGLNKTPDSQSVASLELGGFDSLSLGGAGPTSSPEGGLSELRGALEGVQWEAANSALREEGQEWRRCLQGCLALLQAAARILGAIDDPQVAEEVVSSREGEDYLANLLEVYCVTQRISAASHQLLPACRLTLEPLLAEVEIAWQILTPFLERSSIEINRDRKWNVSVDNSAQCCALCLVLVEDAEGNTGIIRSGQHSYHASCANLWVNCVSESLPTISVP